MRHLRVLALCLVATFAMSATTFVVASPALAKCNAECKEQKREEKERKKTEKEEARLFNYEKLFDQCPIGATVVLKNGEERTLSGKSTAYNASCNYGEAGKESFFQAGKVTIHFKKPIILRGGFVEESEGAEGVQTYYVGARYGDTISKESEPAPPLTEDIDAEALPPAEKTRYEEYLASGGSTKSAATVELAKPASNIFLSADNLLEESGEAFGFPVMVHLENKFLGTHCYVGNAVEPIEVAFTTGETSPPPPNEPIHGLALESIGAISYGSIIVLEGTHLVNNSYAAPGVQGCGVNGGADAGLDAGLGLPSPAGSNTTELIGDLWLGEPSAVEEHVHF